MNKILLALTLLGTGGGAFLAVRQSTTALRCEANASREAWLLQTQLVAIAQTNQAALIERVRQLKEALAQVPTAKENPLWVALQTNHVGHLPPELRERLFEELGLSWKSSEQFILVSKETIHEIWTKTIEDGKPTEIASTVLGLTPRERDQVAAAIQRVQTDFNDWVRSHTERSGPKREVVAEYTLHKDDTYLSISNRFAAGLHEAVGMERAELILDSAVAFPFTAGIHQGDTMIMTLKRHLVGHEQRLQVQVMDTGPAPQRWPWVGEQDVSQGSWFPPPFRPIFPNGWPDVAKREGFDLPAKSEEK